MDFHPRSRAALGSILVLLLCGAGTAFAQTPTPAQLDYPDDPDFMVLEYTVTHDELAENDPIPLLRIYGDGTVRVHIPVYMKGAGDFSLKLPADELRSLLTAVDAAGVLGFDAERVAESKAEAVEARFQRDGTYLDISDTSWTHIRVRLETYQPAASGAPAGSFDRQIRWPDVAWHAEHYPSLVEVRNLANVEQRLRGLLRHPALQAIDSPES
ncbi:MAG: hypothetical protein AAGD06_15830 [Acidobacteriota bacterium]